MAVELEAKLKVESHDDVRAKLRALAGRFVGRTLEVNTFFDAPEGTLKKADRGLRLRINQDMDSETRAAVVTMKGPQGAGAFKNREEIETEVSDPGATAEIFNRLGYRQTISFEKRRESWEIDHCKVELDEVPHLGFFVEIEGPDEGRIETVRRHLGLEGAESIKVSYIGMLARWLSERGSLVKEIKFPRHA